MLDVNVEINRIMNAATLKAAPKQPMDEVCCWNCNGKGEHSIDVTQSYHWEPQEETTDCERCNGSGVLWVDEIIAKMDSALIFEAITESDESQFIKAVRANDHAEIGRVVVQMLVDYLQRLECK